MKKISRELNVSRNTVRKIVRSSETDFTYERTNQPLPRIGPWQSQLEQFQVSNAGKASRERLTLIRIFEELRGLGYEGGYDAVRRFAKTWSEKRGAATAEAYVPLYYAPGEAYQFDWSHEVVLIAGVTVTVKVAHVRLCHSRMIFVRAYMRESQEPRHRARTDGASMARCLTRMTEHLPSSRAPARAASTTASIVRHWSEDNGREDRREGGVHRQRAAIQPPIPADVQPLPCPASRLNSGVRLGEGPGREPGWADPGTVLHPAFAGQKLGRTERLALGQMRGLRQSEPSSGPDRQDDLGCVRDGTASACAIWRDVRLIPQRARVGVEDLYGAVRQ